MIRHITSGPIVALELLGDHAVTRWQELMGPEDSKEAVTKAPSSIRARYGIDNILNAVHGPEDEAAAERVCAFIYLYTGDNIPSITFVFFQGVTTFLPQPENWQKGTSKHCNFGKLHLLHH